MLNNWKKLFALILCVAMVLTLIPATAFAAADAVTAAPAQTLPMRDKGEPHGRGTEKAAPDASRGDTVLETPLAEGDNAFVVSAGETVYRPFTPTKDGLYRIYSVTDYDTYGYLTDAELNQISYNDDGGENWNFALFSQLSAGTTYYIGARYYSSSYSGTINVTIEWHDADACGDNLKWSFDSASGTLTITGTGDMWDFSVDWNMYCTTAPWGTFSDEITSVVVKNGVTGIGIYAFYSCANLTDVTLSDSVTHINESAFIYCYTLKQITLPAGLLYIGYNAFCYCSDLQSITLPNNLQTIYSYAFEFSGLTSLHIPASVSQIGAGFVDGCYSLTAGNFSVDAGNPNYKAENGVLFNKDGSYLHTYLCANTQSSYTVPAGVREIGYYAFCDCSNLTTVTLSAGVETVCEWAFGWCGLKSITISNTVTSIEYGAFYYCENLTDVHYQGTAATRYDTLTIDEYGDESGSYNRWLLNATWHYQDDLEPSDFDGTIEWNKADVEFKGTTPYVVANGSAQEPRFTVKKADGTVVDPGTYTYRYAENTNAGTGYVIVKFTSGFTGETRAWFKIYLPPTTFTSVENVDDGILVKWNAVEGAAGYVIYRRAWSTTTGGWTAFSRWNNTTELSYLDGIDDSHKVYAGTRYQYGVKAYFAQRYDAVTGDLIGGNVGDNFNLGVVGPLKTTVRITTRTLSKLVAGSSKITAYWAGSKNFTGYQLSYATDAAFTKNVKTVKITNASTVSKEVKSLTNGTLYYFRIRSYQDFEGMTYFGGWSNVLSVKPGSGQTVTATSAKYRALVVGQNAYPSSPLYGCVNDMNAMAGMLKGLASPFTVTTLKNASSSQILNGIKTAFAGATDNDVSLFHYSGHGVYTSSTSSSYLGALCGVDDTYITMKQLADELSKVKGRVIIILDSCHSGAGIGKAMNEDELDAFNRSVIEAFSGYTLEPQEGERMGELKQSKFIVITAASYSQSSYDGRFDGSGYDQGAFTAALIKGMGCKYPNGARNGSSTPADKDSNKKITLKELYDYVYTTAYNWTSSQKAQYYGTDSTVLFQR